MQPGSGGRIHFPSKITVPDSDGKCTAVVWRRTNASTDCRARALICSELHEVTHGDGWHRSSRTPIESMRPRRTVRVDAASAVVNDRQWRLNRRRSACSPNRLPCRNRCSRTDRSTRFAAITNLSTAVRYGKCTIVSRRGILYNSGQFGFPWVSISRVHWLSSATAHLTER